MTDTNKPNENGTFSELSLAGSGEIALNDSGTCEKIDTPLTQPCSGFDLTYENDRRQLHHARNLIDAASADGHTYSNIMELRKNWELCRPGDFAEQHLPRLMLVQEQRLVVTRPALPAPPKMLTYQPEEE